ncbi:MAG: phospho-N-acetylmuramoyl-pentapeptide-transferase [Bacteroidetes bacterium]|nr:MAG: phospho-N-acetylmuramoyl-pentapeptide-transferase [Bacteroidota bacterium]
MLYSLYHALAHYDIPGLGLLRYLSFRAGVAFVLALLVTVAFGGRFIRIMRRLQIGEEIRDLGFEDQMAKRGTPTMGGILILAATIIPSLLLADLRNPYIFIMLVSTVWLGLIGGTDDYIKVFRGNKKGLNGWIKIMGQVGLGLFVGLMLFCSPRVMVRGESPQQTSGERMEVVAVDANAQEVVYEKNLKTTIPFLKDHELDYRDLVPFEGKVGNVIAWGLFVFVVVFIVTAVSNGANLTDGLDGLAAGSSAPMAMVLGVFAYLSGNVIYASYLHIMYIPEVGELLVYIAGFIGALVGFLWYNAYPAQIFMGDTGSLTIGGVLGVYAVLVRKELLLPVLCGVFLLESLSVILQVSYFKYTKRRFGEGRRVFLMSPLHHHYQKKGFVENHIVTRFWIVSILLAGLAVVTLKIR